MMNGKMRAQVVHRPGEMSYEKIPTPHLEDNDILIKVEATLTCGTDIKAYRRGHPILSFPVTVGHEYSGQVVAVGRGVRQFSEGDRVMTVHSGPCGECHFCSRAMENLCVSLTERMVWGGFAEYVKIPSYIHRTNTIKLPERVSYEHAAFLEPVACVLYGMKVIDFTHVQSAVILGGGPIALIFLQRLKAAGVKTVIVAGKHENRLAKAKELGADLVYDVTTSDIRREVLEVTEGYGADLVVECVGKTIAWEQAVQLPRKGGQVLFFGGCPSGSKVSFDTRRVHYDELTLKGAFHFRPQEVREAFDLIERREISLDPLISGEFRLPELIQAFERLMTGHGIKYVIRPEGV